MRTLLHWLDTPLGFGLVVAALTAAYPLTIWACLTWLV